MATEENIAKAEDIIGQLLELLEADPALVFKILKRDWLRRNYPLQDWADDCEAALQELQRALREDDIEDWDAQVEADIQATEARLRKEEGS